KTIKGLEVLRDVEVGAGASQTLVERHAKGLGELRECRDAGELLTILVILLVFKVPEPFVLDEIATCPSATDLAVEGRLLIVRFEQSQIRGEILVAEEGEARSVNRITPASRDDVYSAARSQVGAGVKCRAADLEFLDGLVGDVGRGGAYCFVGNV